MLTGSSATRHTGDPLTMAQLCHLEGHNFPLRALVGWGIVIRRGSEAVTRGTGAADGSNETGGITWSSVGRFDALTEWAAANAALRKGEPVVLNNYGSTWGANHLTFLELLRQARESGNEVRSASPTSLHSTPVPSAFHKHMTLSLWSRVV